MRVDHLNELMNDLRDHNKDTRVYLDKVRLRLKHLDGVRGKIVHDIERLNALENALSMLAAENGAESFKPQPKAPASAPVGGTSMGVQAARAVDRNLDDEIGNDLEAKLSAGT